jgi:hypothetical protein
MDDPIDAGEILARAAGYPYEAPLRSFVQRGAGAEELGERPPDLAARRPLLCYGANAAPRVLARKLAALPPEPLPVLQAELTNFDVVYSAHVSPYGAVPATLQVSEGTTAPVFVAYPNRDQERALTATEPNYELRTLRGAALRVDQVGELGGADVYVSRHGCLALDGSEVALASVASAGRQLPALGEVEVLERIRHILAPELDLGAFVASGLDPGLAAARTAVLRGGARPLRNSQVFFER